MKIYTKVGDGGNTYLFGGRRVPKHHPRIAAQGDIDELNGLLGWAAALAPSAAFRRALAEVQRELFILGADLSAPAGVPVPKAVPRLTPAHIHRLEREIDRRWDRLPPLTNFILPGGSPLGAALHLARAVARRAERTLCALPARDAGPRHGQVYLNRLSDYLFTLARAANHAARRPEQLWKS